MLVSVAIMITFIQRGFLLLVSIVYLYIEYFFRERLLSISSDYGYIFNVAEMESLGRYIAAFGLSWLVFLLLRTRLTGQWWKKVCYHGGIFVFVFVGFFHVQTAGVDWYVENMSLSQKQAAVGAQTFKAFTYYQEKSGEKGYNLDGTITVVDKLLLSFLPWVAYDNTNIRAAMEKKVVLAAQYNVRADVEHHTYRYLNIQDRVHTALYRLSKNYLSTLEKNPSGAGQRVNDPRFGQKVDELHYELQVMAVNAFRVYRQDLLKVYTANVPPLYDLKSDINGNHYIRTYPAALHTRITATGLHYGDWLRSPPPRTVMQEMTKSHAPFVHPVSKVESLLVHYDFTPLVESSDEVAARVRNFNSVAQNVLLYIDGDRGIESSLLGQYSKAVTQVEGCTRYESPTDLPHSYGSAWTGEGHYFVQNHHAWNSAHYRLRGLDKTVQVTMRSATDWSRRPLRYETSTFYAALISGMAGKGSMTVCDPLRYGAAFNRYVHPMMLSMNEHTYGVTADMVTFEQFIKSAYWREVMPRRVKQHGFTVSSDFNWRSKSAIANALTKHTGHKYQAIFEKTLLSRLAAFSSHYDVAGVTALYQDLSVPLPLWQLSNTNENVRRVMIFLSNQPVVRSVIKREYPFLYDSDDQLMVLYLDEGEGKYRQHRKLAQDYRLRVADVLSGQAEENLTNPESEFYLQQTRAFIVVPLALLLSTLFILLNVVNVVFMILQWTPLSSRWLQVLRFVVLFTVLALPMVSDNEYTESGFYEGYLTYGSSTLTIQLTIWLQGSAPVFDLVNETMGRKLHKHGESVLDTLSETLSKE
jgi:hypothetical protein